MAAEISVLDMTVKKHYLSYLLKDPIGMILLFRINLRPEESIVVK